MLLLGRQTRVGEELRSQVAGEHEDRVAEVDRAPLAVGETPVVEHLQQDVEDVGVGLLHLVEQDDRVGATPHGLGELAALLVTDVSRGRTDQP